jgi:hypothetical protein
MGIMTMASDWERQRVKEVARAVLEGQLSILEGTRALRPLAFTDAIANESDRNLIIGIESETDHLPIGDVRQLWAPSALAEKDHEISRCEALWKEDVLAACRRMLTP